jgi:hypothetical protein
MTTTQPTVLWGTNPPGGTGHRYGGRVHIVPPGGAPTGHCGLPVATVTPKPPPPGLRLCPECCQLAITRLFT